MNTNKKINQEKCKHMKTIRVEYIDRIANVCINCKKELEDNSNNCNLKIVFKE